MSRHLAGLAILTATLSFTALTLGGQGAPTRRPLFDNPAVEVVRLLLPPGAREMPHTHPYSFLIVHLTRGDVEMRKGNEVVREVRDPGAVDFVAREVSHAAANAGSAAFEVLTIAFKPDRVPGGQGSPTAPPPGVTPRRVTDNADATVTRLDFGPSAREAVHVHPYDLVVVPLTAARVEIQIGTSKEMRMLAPGDAVFIPRSEPHAFANLTAEPFAVLGVAIK